MEDTVALSGLPPRSCNERSTGCRTGADCRTSRGLSRLFGPMKRKKRIPAIRLLSHDQFQRLTVDQKLTYLASAFQALIKRQLKYPFILQHDPDRRKSPRATRKTLLRIRPIWKAVITGAAIRAREARSKLCVGLCGRCRLLSGILSTESAGDFMKSRSPQHCRHPR